MTRNFVSPEEIPLLRWEDSVSADRVSIVDGMADTNTLISSGNEILNSLKGFVSISNSTSTTLASSGIFEGSPELTNGYGIIYINVFSDVQSEIDGLKILQSSDGTNWDFCDSYTIPANRGKNFSVNPHGKYFKIKYTNGNSTQSQFRLQTSLKLNGLPSSHRIQDSIIDDDDAQLIKNVQAYYDINDGEYTNVGIQNPLPVDGDSVYAKDIWEHKSNIGNFSGRIRDLFNNLNTTIEDNTTNNPKEIIIHFNRTVVSNVVGLGCYEGGDFSNVKIEIMNSGATYTTVIDESLINIKYTSRIFKLPITSGFNAIKLSFYTSDPVCLSNVVVLKTKGVVSRLQASDSNGIVQDINCNLSIGRNYYLNVSTIQNSYLDPNNSSTTNLTSVNTYTFAGSATETISANAIQVILKTDKNANVYIDQSGDGVSWDITDSYIYYYSKGGFSKTVKSIGDYYRVRVNLLENEDTTYFRLSTKIVPISEPLPESLDKYDRVKTTTGIIDLETEKIAEVESLGALKVISPVGLIGSPFNNGIKDPNFWSEVVVGSGTVTQSGQIILSTGTIANSSARYDTVNKARKVTGTTNQYRMVGRLTTPPQINNIRRAGCYDNNNGFFFQVDGETFGVGVRKNGINTITPNGEFNGNYGATITIGTTIRRFVIEYTSISAKFFVDEKLLHTIRSPLDALVNTFDLPIRLENQNINGNTTNNSFQIRFAVILRLGELETQPTYKYQSGITTGVVCKYSSGNLRGVIISGVNNNAVVTLYDNIVASGPIIWGSGSMGAQTIPLDLDFKSLSFSTGLTLVISGANCNVLLIYE